MKKIVIAFLIIMGSITIQAQDVVWHTDIVKATKIANKTKKPLMLFFTGSDWCGWCIRLQKEVFKTPEFESWAKDNVVLVELDFPRRTPQAPELMTQNAEIQQFFGIRGYPTVWFTNANQNDKASNKISFEQLGTTGYVAGGPSAWLSVANSILKI